MTAYLPPSNAEIAKHRQEVEQWPWFRQVWHRMVGTCFLCQWHRLRMKDGQAPEQRRDEPPNSRP